jgi:hypothetical protein
VSRQCTKSAFSTKIIFFVLATLGAGSPTAAQENLKPNGPTFAQGPADVAVNSIVWIPTTIHGGPLPSGINESAVATVTVANLLTPDPPVVTPQGPISLLRGSDARNVTVRFAVGFPEVTLVGMTPPPGWQCYLAQSQKHRVCDGDIPASGSVQFKLEVIAGKPWFLHCHSQQLGGGYYSYIAVDADHFDAVQETSKVNNQASSPLHVFTKCP